MLPAVFFLWSSAFSNGDPIPPRYTADGDDVSPPLQWELNGVAESFAVICEDPDAPAGNWVHWVIYNIPGDATGIDEGVEAVPLLSNGAIQGRNSWGTVGYRGPAPPSGTHRYFFRIYALNKSLDLPAAADADELRQAMEGSIVASTELMGMYSRD